jgi:homoserine O-acetyltransferase
MPGAQHRSKTEETWVTVSECEGELPRTRKPTVYLPAAKVFPAREINIEVHGDPDLPAVVVLGGISATHHLAAHGADPRRGWWDPFVGAGRALDTTQYSVIGIDYVAGTVGSVTTEDQAGALSAALDRLGVRSVHTFVGSSYGGMVALAFAALHPERVRQLVLISAAHQTHPMATALRSIQRQVVRLGLTHGRAGEGLRLAGALAMTTYRTAEEFAARFDSAPEWTPSGPRFPVEDYLDAAAERFAATVSPQRFLALSESIDLHRVDPAVVRVPTTLVGVDSDVLVPLWQIRELGDRLGGPVRLYEISSRYGHDAFLKEVEVVSRIIADALETEADHE